MVTIMTILRNAPYIEVTMPGLQPQTMVVDRIVDGRVVFNPVCDPTSLRSFELVELAWSGGVKVTASSLGVVSHHA